jgi:predicted metal-binding membrane protein
VAGAERVAGRLEALLRRDRALVLSAVLGVTALCWAHLFAAARAMVMDGEAAMAMARIAPWSARDLALLLLMWVVMMVGMMLPSATPMLLLYAQVARKAASEGRPLAPTGLFALGYATAWALFCVAATAAQWGLDRLALLSPAMVATSPALGAAILMGAGLYQLTPWKEACLRHCRAPALFLASRWRRGASGALRMGFEHGGFCLGCCWALMALLFVGGVMNLLWIGAITLFVLLEKLAPRGATGPRLGGFALLALGAAVAAGWLRT